MKLARFLLISVAAILVVLLICAGLVLNPGFQTALIHRALARQKDLHLEIGHLAAGLHQAELTDVVYEADGLRIRVPKVTADVSALTAIFSRKLAIAQLTAKGWTIETRPVRSAAVPAAALPPPSTVPPSSSAATGAAVTTPTQGAAAAVSPVAEFSGVLTRLRLPFDLQVENVDLSGRIILVASGGHADIRVSQGGLGAGATAHFAVHADAALADSRINSLAIAGTVMVVMDTPRTFSQVALQLESTASGPNLAHPVAIKGDFSAERMGTAETYAATLISGDRRLAHLKADFPATRERLTGDWNLDLRNDDLAPFMLGHPLPQFTAAGHGQWQSDLAWNNIQTSGSLDARVDRLASLSPELSGIGAVSIRADVDLAQHGDVTRVTRFNAMAEGRRPVATIRALQAFEFNRKTGELRASDPMADLLGVVLQGVPLAWIQPFAPDLTLDGGDLQGEFVATPRGGGVSFRSKVPVTVSRLSVAKSGKPLVHAVDVSMSSSGDYTPHGWQAELSGFAAGAGGPRMILLNAKAGRLAGMDQSMKATGLLSVDLGALFTQPAVHDLARVEQGSATVEFAATIGGTKELQATVAVKSLSAGGRAAQPALPTLGAAVRADLKPDGTVTFNAPIAIERRGRKSDLTIVGSISPRSHDFEAHLASGKLLVDDVKSLSALVPPPAKQAADRHEAAGAGAPWSGLHGTVSLQLKSVEYSGTFQMSNVTGKLRISDGAIKFDDVHGTVGEGGDARVNGTLTFDPAAARPFSAGADVALTDFDPGPLLAAGNPGQPPIVEGKFAVTTEVTARAAKLEELPQAAVGEFALTSRGGVFRALPVNVGNLVENSGKLASWLASAGSAITSLAGRKDYDDITSRSQAANELAKILSAIPYDQLGMVVSRDEARNLNVKELTLISPELRISGSGRARGGPGSSLLNDVVELDLRLRARGRPAELMKYLGVLDGKPDDLGYAACTIPVRLEGSLQKPDTTQLSNRLVALAVEKTGLTEKAVDWINRLRGKGPN
jgi:hypothetical protein